MNYTSLIIDTLQIKACEKRVESETCHDSSIWVGEMFTLSYRLL